MSLELKFAGHKYICFDSPLLKNPQTDAIICDFQMPSGLEFYLWARQTSFMEPFYILTCEPTIDVKHLLDQGITEVLFKPQDLNKLSKLFK